jgi:hypothetical protein
MRWFRRHYGAGPLHLLSLLACFAFSAYVVDKMLRAGEGRRIVVWFVAAAVLHDVVLFPLYALADRSAGWLDARRHPERLPRVPWINHVRVPAVMSAVLLAVSFPLVLRLSQPTYHAASGLNENAYRAHYLLIVAALFAVSAVLYALRVGRASRAVTPVAATAPGGTPVTAPAPVPAGVDDGGTDGTTAAPGDGQPG